MPFLREWTVTSPSKLDPSPPLPCISGLPDRICFCNTFRFLWASFQIQSSLCFNYKHCMMHVLSETHYWGRRPSYDFPTSTEGWISSLPVSWALWGCCWHLGRAANVPQTPWTEVFVHSLFSAQSTLAHEKLASTEVVLVGIASKLRWLRRTSGEEQHVSPFSRIAAGRNQLVVQAQAVLASWRGAPRNGCQIRNSCIPAYPSAAGTMCQTRARREGVPWRGDFSKPHRKSVFSSSVQALISSS